MPVFEYKAAPNTYIPFENASAGQQATALLTALLNQGGEPLLIDQPEDDLDNTDPFKVVERLWRAKERRQLIFTSHNANLVVNGDAEFIVHCDYLTQLDRSKGRIALEGAIDSPHVCEAIKKAMEGGERAFRLRQQKYGFQQAQTRRALECYLLELLRCAEGVAMPTQQHSTLTYNGQTVEVAVRNYQPSPRGALGRFWSNRLLGS